MNAYQDAERLVVQVLRQGVMPPQVFPLPDGGLSIEWHRPSMQLSIRLPGEEGIADASVYLFDGQADEEWEERLDAALPKVTEVLTDFVNPAG
jgi:hypothetical protein